MDVNDNACFLNKRAVLQSIVGTPPEAITRSRQGGSPTQLKGIFRARLDAAAQACTLARKGVVQPLTVISFSATEAKAPQAGGYQVQRLQVPARVQRGKV